MASTQTFHCETCGYHSPKWMGFCPQCGSSEALTELVGKTSSSSGRRATSIPLHVATEEREERLRTTWPELDRVLGGGLVKGSVVLLGGDPGVGKSTLLLQMAGRIAERGMRVVVASAEESAAQVALRARRLGIDSDDVGLVSDDDVDAIVELGRTELPAVLVVDSIQTVGVAEIASAPGGVSQVRESAARLIRLAKTTGVVVVLVGHVTKDGGLAGPKILEHMVDVVLYLEGDPDRGFRVLRSNKNRFGATHVAGMFDMQGDGLVEVDDPSKLFLDGWETDVPGTIVYPAVEGRRSVLVEIQGLVAPAQQAQPRRSVRGLDLARLNQLIAVLGRHAGIRLDDREVYVNVVGGWRLDEPGCDLPIALALVSSALDRPLGRIAAWGEVGLAGEVRAVPFAARREEELKRMGLDRYITATGGEPMRLADAIALSGLDTPGGVIA